jgi:hypothetical protein
LIINSKRRKTMALKLDALITYIKGLQFPPQTKVRVSVTGLAYCQLSSGISRINFLKVPNHALTLTIIKRRAPPNSELSVDSFDLDVSDTNLSVSVGAPVSLASHETNYPSLRKMINLNDLHKGSLELKSSAGTFSRARLALHDCAFYTLAEYPDLLNLVLVGQPSSASPIRVGFVLAGNIGATAANTTTTIVSRTLSEVFKTLPGQDGGGELFYDLIFNNHCNAFNPQTCRDDVGGGTDFKYYYEVFQEQSGRKFDLEIIPALPESERPTFDPTAIPTIGTDVAACNPIITDPPEW